MGGASAPLFNMTKRLLDYDPLTGVSCWFEYRHASDEMVLSHTQDVSAIIDANKAQANDDDKTKRGFKNDWWKYATVPTVVEIEWLQKFGVQLDNPGHKKKIFQLLNHPDYRYLKTTAKVHHVHAD